MTDAERSRETRNLSPAAAAAPSGMRIEARAPTRIDLAGGTLDIWPLYLFHEGAMTVNCAITRYAKCCVDVAQDAMGSGTITLRSVDTRREERFPSLVGLSRARSYRLPLLARLVKVFHPCRGFTLTTDSEAPAGAGIGGSSAMAVAICAALARLTKANPNRKEWIRLSRDVEAIVLGVPTGTQDHYPAAFGGVMAVVLEAGGERREALQVDPEELESRLVLCYTGKPRRSGINNWKIFQDHLNGDRSVRRNLDEIAAIARAMRKALESSDWNEAGRLMREEWSFRRRTLPGISTATIDGIVLAARRAGALAGKACGAGGGGCVALMIPRDARVRVERAIETAGGQILAMRIARRGVQVRTQLGAS
jgi:D-glycero-alpha-D-manno-heptose-7-phosphate kinase